MCLARDSPMNKGIEISYRGIDVVKRLLVTCCNEMEAKKNLNLLRER